MHSLVASALVLLLAATTLACGPADGATGAPPTASVATPSPVATPVLASDLPSASPQPSAAGFAFDAASILGYFASIGYACGAAQPSTQAAGHLFRSCRLVAPDGRTRIVGIVTDSEGTIADAYASITGTADEPILAPADVIEPFAAFLGATLGEGQGASLLEWLAGHLGDEYAATSIGGLTVATYTASPEDHATLYVEIASPAYLASPTPGPSPT